MLVSLGVVPEGATAELIAWAAFLALGLAVALTCVQLWIGDGSRPRILHRPITVPTRSWVVGAVATALIMAMAVQTWFRPGTAIGAGDTVFPGGFAWLSRLADPWIWTGFSLGEPSQLPLSLPWAATLSFVHFLGGDPGVGQRVWYTLLFIAAGLGAFALCAALRFGPTAAFVGALLYVFNACTVSEVNTNPVYLAALFPLAAIPAVLVAAGSGRIPVLSGAALIGCAAPIVGYVFFNPPLVGMLLLAAIATPLLVAWVDGPRSGWRSARTLALGIPILLVLSAYWIVPAAIRLSGFTGSHLATLSSWSWTEIRATIRNAFWLNDVWGWNFPEYFPFASTYDKFPISVLRFVVPAVAFGALALRAVRSNPHSAQGRNRDLRIAVAMAAVSLVVILISTGTNPPGAPIFQFLYSLPFGWLLREPDRFLMLVGLCYAVLLAVLIDGILGRRTIRQLLESASVRTTELDLSWRSLRIALVPLAIGSSLVTAFPIYTGAAVPDIRPLLPPAHVTLPTYWKDMAGVVDSSPRQGNVLVLPPDDFYGMPYTWGYYGADSFISDLFNRPVLVPNPQGYGYVPTPPALLGAVNLAASSIVRGDWNSAEAALRALNTPLILVRRDIQVPFQGRPIISPDTLTQALLFAPNIRLVYRVGLLDLFELKTSTVNTETGANFMTVNTDAPDLRLISLISQGSDLVTHEPLAGIPSAYQAPPLEEWPIEGKDIVWRPQIGPAAAYKLVELNSGQAATLGRPGETKLSTSGVRVTYSPENSAGAVQVSVAARSAITNGAFDQGGWGPVGDCNALSPAEALPSLGATVVPQAGPNGEPALQLSAGLDSACVNRPLNWHGGPVLLNMMANGLQGAVPRFCIWETGPERCASAGPTSPAVAPLDSTRCCSLPALATGWSSYRGAFTADPGTTQLTLYLYADANQAGIDAIVQYADIAVTEVPALSSLALVAYPPSGTDNTFDLLVSHDAFSSSWEGPSASIHVLVNGMTNGWLMPRGSSATAPEYRPAKLFAAAQWVSILAAPAVGLLVVCVSLIRRRNRAPRTLASSRTA